jgi:hypothetical protein
MGGDGLEDIPTKTSQKYTARKTTKKNTSGLDDASRFGNINGEKVPRDMKLAESR